MKTLANKITALILIAIGIVSCKVDIYHDATFLIFSLLFGVPLFFAKKNWTQW